MARARYRVHLAEFCHTVFPDRFEYAWSPVHKDLLARAARKRPWSQRQDEVKRAVAAPRASAKSTLVSFADVVHDVVYGIERFIVMVSTTADLSEELVKDLHGAFSNPEAYPELHALYGPFVVKGGETAFVVRCKTGDPAGTRIWPTSVKGTIRGQKWAGIRPTRIIIDDYEHPKHVMSPAQRAFSWTFLTKDVEKAGRRGTVIDIVGTVLHPDAVMARVLKHSSWRSTRYQSLLSWPKRADLWERARALWADLTNMDRKDAARAFYDANREAMDEGAAVLWPEGKPLWNLMVSWWSDPAAFWSEEMNEPRDPSRSFFLPDEFKRCTWDGRTLVWADGRKVPLQELEVAIWHDRAKGGKTNDYPATAVVARDRFGYRAVLEVNMTREPPTGQRARLWRMWEAYLPAKSVTVGCDDTAQTEVFAGESFERERKDRQQRGVRWNLDIKSHTLSEDKNARIGSQEPDTKHGWIQFASTLPSEVMEQYRDFPNAAHDDAPDAIERADWLLRDTMPTIERNWRG